MSAARAMVRPILAVGASYVAWIVAFWVPIIVMALFWPALRATGQAVWEQGRYDVFDTSMLWTFQGVWLIANFAAGFVAGWIGRRQSIVLWVAGLLFVYFAYNHLWALWGVMPDWYNALVVIPVVPMVLIGGWIGLSVGVRPEPRSAGAHDDYDRLDARSVKHEQ